MSCDICGEKMTAYYTDHLRFSNIVYLSCPNGHKDHQLIRTKDSWKEMT